MTIQSTSTTTPSNKEESKKTPQGASRKHSPASMVGWYDPGLLLRTGKDVFMSTLFTQTIDGRLVEALIDGVPAIRDPAAKPYVDYSERTSDFFWLDFIADVGDGYDSTFAVARAAAQDLSFFEMGTHQTKQSQVIVIGGDLSYPVGNREQYEQRLLLPFDEAFQQRKENKTTPELYAIPGNHDWYDNLAAFLPLFCSGRRKVAGCQTRQTRSYFAMKLPHGWWMLGVDIQLSSDIDNAQVHFFREVAKDIQPDDGIILCVAEPHWIYSAAYKDLNPNFTENNLKFLEEDVLNKCKQIRVFLSGDLHHYKRYESQDKTQKITAGGGGAFLHPTHGALHSESLPDGDKPDVFAHQTSYPKLTDSEELCRGNLNFLGKNPKFGLLPALIYFLICWTVPIKLAALKTEELFSFQKLAKLFLNAAVESPALGLWFLIVVGGFILFTDTHSKRYRVIAGPIHGLIHFIAAGFSGWLGSLLASLLVSEGPLRTLFAGLVIFPVAWILGSEIMGAYLYYSLNRHGRHSNEAFSALRIADYKNFLRLRFGPEGLTIYPIGIDKVPQNHKQLCKEPYPIKATLIENPIPVPKRG
jgi:hypothetical protein